MSVSDIVASVLQQQQQMNIDLLDSVLQKSDSILKSQQNIMHLCNKLLSDLKDPDPTLNEGDEAIAASSNLESKGGVSLSKCDESFEQKKCHKDKGNASFKQADKTNEPVKTQNSSCNSKPPKKYCTNCVSETHWTKHCWNLNKENKQINNLDVCSENHSDNQAGQEGDFNTFHCYKAVDHKLAGHGGGL